MSSDDPRHLVPVLKALVDTAGLKAVLLSLAGTCHARAIECVGSEPAFSETWETVADDIESFARTSLRGLR